MDANRQYFLKSGNSIEFCEATPTGPYVDIPLRDLAPIMVQVLQHDLLSAEEAEFVLVAAANSAQRQHRGRKPSFQ